MAGVLLAALLMLGLEVHQSFRLPPFFDADERAHFAYTVSLLEGDLPEITDGQSFADRYPIIERSLDPPSSPPARQRPIWVANHPPLHYALTAPSCGSPGDQVPMCIRRSLSGW